VPCEGRRCIVRGEGTIYATIDYVFAYTPTFVRFAPPDVIDYEFDPPIDCERRDDYDHNISYLYCAPALLPTKIEAEGGDVYLVEVSGVDKNRGY